MSDTTPQKGHEDKPVMGLIAAFKAGQVNITSLRANIGPLWDVNETDENGTTALHYAVKMGERSILEVMLERGAGLNTVDNTGRTVLSLAAELGSEDVLELLLENSTIDLNLADQSGLTPINWAASCGNHRAVSLLAGKHGTDINTMDNQGSSPLIWAASRGRNGVVKVLVNHKDIKLNDEDNNGKTALCWAAQSGYLGPVKELLAAQGINANSRDKWGFTPLHWAAYKGELHVVNELLASDLVDPESRDKDRRTPLSWAADRGYANVVMSLVRKGVDVNSRDTSESTPLVWAACHDHEDAVRALVEAGADLRLGDKDDWTALMWAEHRKYKGVIKVLKPSVDSSDDEEESLHTSVEVRSSDVRSTVAITLDSLPTRHHQSLQNVNPIVEGYLFDDEGDEFEPSATRSADIWIAEYEKMLEDKIGPLLHDIPSKHVKVAILDSGVDWKDDCIVGAVNIGRIKKFRTFIGQDKDVVPQKKSYVKDTFGHGTHALALLINTSHDADIYVAKVAEDGKLDDPACVAKAIMCAVDEWKVDIISMSLGFAKMHDEIADAVKHASNNDVVILAAASNYGGNRKTAFPASLEHNVLAINSTDGYGIPSAFNPIDLRGNDNLSVLGYAVKSSWPRARGGKSSETRRKAGTSFATPIAAGMAAVLLRYAKVMPGFKLRKTLSGRDGSPNKLRAMLLKVAEVDRGSVTYAYLAFTKFFDDNSKDLARELLAKAWNSNI